MSDPSRGNHAGFQAALLCKAGHSNYATAAQLIHQCNALVTYSQHTFCTCTTAAARANMQIFRPWHWGPQQACSIRTEDCKTVCFLFAFYQASTTSENSMRKTMLVGSQQASFQVILLCKGGHSNPAAADLLVAQRPCCIESKQCLAVATGNSKQN